MSRSVSTVPALIKAPPVLGMFILTYVVFRSLKSTDTLDSTKVSLVLFSGVEIESGVCSYPIEIHSPIPSSINPD